MNNFLKTAAIFVLMGFVGLLLLIAVNCGGGCKYLAERCFADSIQACDQYGSWQELEACQDWAPGDDPYAAMMCVEDPLQGAHCITAQQKETNNNVN